MFLLNKTISILVFSTRFGYLETILKYNSCIKTCLPTMIIYVKTFCIQHTYNLYV